MQKDPRKRAASCQLLSTSAKLAIVVKLQHFSVTLCPPWADF